MSGRARGDLVTRIAMELRQIEAEDAAAISGNRYDRSPVETWERAGEPLRIGYLRDARRIVRIMRQSRRKPEAQP